MLSAKEILRLEIFKKSLSDKERDVLLKFSNDELLAILNKAVLPNAYSINAVKNTHFFGRIFHNSRDVERFSKDILGLDILLINLSKIERTLIKFGALKGFSTPSWQTQMYRFIHTPLNLDNRTLGGRKLVYSRTFEEIFPFIYKIIKKGEKNDRFPKF